MLTTTQVNHTGAWCPGERTMELIRKYFIVVEFPSELIFQEFLDKADEKKIHHLRENSLTDYIWTLYEDWNIKDWVNNK